MLPLTIHDWIHSLETVGYRADYGENAYKDPTVFFARALPGDVVDTLSLTQKIFHRGYRPGNQNSSRSVLTSVGVVYIDYRQKDGEFGTLITVPQWVSAANRESDKLRYEAML